MQTLNPIRATCPPAGGTLFKAVVRKYANGEVRLRMSPAALRILDHESKLQEPANDDWSIQAVMERRVRRDLEQTSHQSDRKAGFGSLALDEHTGEVHETKFGARAKQTLKEFGKVLDDKFGKDSVFFTLTLPSSTKAAYKAVAEWSAYIVQRVTQWMRDHLKEAWYAWVWEWQKRGALHLHLVCGDNDYVGLVLLALNWKEFCIDLLHQVETKSNCDLLTHFKNGKTCRCRDDIQMDAVFVRLSAARYLAKYMGKVRTKGNVENALCPSRWWRVSNSALTAIRQQRDFVVLESNNSTTLDAMVEVVARALNHQDVIVNEYPNKLFPFLRNLIFWTETDQDAADLWREVRKIATLITGGDICVSASRDMLPAPS